MYNKSAIGPDKCKSNKFISDFTGTKDTASNKLSRGDTAEFHGRPHSRVAPTKKRVTKRKKAIIIQTKFVDETGVIRVSQSVKYFIKKEDNVCFVKNAEIN